MSKKVINPIDRRKFLRMGLQGIAGAATIGVGAGLFMNSGQEKLVWQLNPEKCIQCEKCAVNCVLPQSAVKCIHTYAMCGYCDLCSGYLRPGTSIRDTGAESAICPTGAIKRTFIEDPYFEYQIDHELCIGCGRCVKGCDAFGNGSLYLQVQRELCVDCNECSIARSCPSQAYERIPATQAYILRGEIDFKVHKKIK